jgi:hypothetical protein
VTDSPIIVHVTRGPDEKLFLQLYQAPNIQAEPGLEGLTEFVCDMSGFTGIGDAEMVKHHGQRLLASLRSSNALVDKALKQAFELGASACRPIYLEIKALPTAETYCWEALCTDKGDFLALDRRWPVARVVGSYAPRREARSFAGVLKILAVLTPADIDPTREWNALYKAVQEARRQGLMIDLHVATSHEPLIDQIEDLLDTDARLFQFAFTDMVGLVGRADNLQPHLVHFFCHGSTSLGKPRLELATLNDAGAEPIELTMTDLLASPGLSRCWLAVLNCCDSGRAGKDMMSLGASLVAGGMHAAIGMKEEVEVPDAAAFSEKLYPALMRNLTEALTTPGSEDVLIEWSSSMWEPRRGLSDFPTRAWTLPVIYVQRTEFRVHRGATDPGVELMAARNRTIDDFLAHLPPEKRALLREELALHGRG